MSDLLLNLACLSVSGLSALPFAGQAWHRPVLAILGGLPLYWAIRQWQEGRQLFFVREQFKWLLEHLLTKLSSGATLEKAFLDAQADIGKILGKNASLLTALARTEKQLAARMPLDQILPQFNQCLPCPEARRFLAILPQICQSGGQVAQFVRQQMAMLLEQISLQQDIGAESTQRHTEALLLAGMPFLLAYLLQHSSESLSGGLIHSPFGMAGLLLAWGMAAAAAVLTVRTLAMPESFIQKPRLDIMANNPFLRLKFLETAGHLLKSIYQNWLPASFGSRLLQLINDSEQPDSQFAKHCHLGLPAFFRHKALYLMTMSLPAGLILLAMPRLWFICPILLLAISILQDIQVFQEAQRRRTEYQLEYPSFLNLIASLLNSGLSVHKALDIGLRTYLAHAGSSCGSRHTAMNRDLLEIKKSLQLGQPAGLILDKIAATCPLAEARAALILVARYDRTGGQDTLMMLQVQALACQSLYRNTVRKQLELRSLQLLLPMTLDLVSVVIITILPALLSLQAF